MKTCIRLLVFLYLATCFDYFLTHSLNYQTKTSLWRVYDIPLQRGLETMWKPNFSGGPPVEEKAAT